MLTEAYTTIDEAGNWYIRRDIDSRHRIIGEMDYQREAATGIPAYVGWQMQVHEVPETAEELASKVEELQQYDLATLKFLIAFVRMVKRFKLKARDKA